jgi:hypothetical protein
VGLEQLRNHEYLCVITCCWQLVAAAAAAAAATTAGEAFDPKELIWFEQERQCLLLLHHWLGV